MPDSNTKSHIARPVFLKIYKYKGVYAEPVSREYQLEDGMTLAAAIFVKFVIDMYGKISPSVLKMALQVHAPEVIERWQEVDEYGEIVYYRSGVGLEVKILGE